jgi:hypothetical protein
VAASGAAGEGPAQGWLEDQVAAAAACRAAAGTVPSARASAVQLAALIVDAYQDPETGHLSEAPRRGESRPASHDVVDHAIDAAVPTAAALLTTLGADPDVGAPDRARFLAAADGVRRSYLDAAD